MSITFPLGFRAAATRAGIKPSGNPDLVLLVRDGPDSGATGAGMLFTTNRVVGAPVTLGLCVRQRLLTPGLGGFLRALLINAGNSNAATGEQGVRDAERCAAETARALGCPADGVLMSSTGVIGRPLPVDRIIAAIPELTAGLGRGERADAEAARAIMTTDRVPKTARREVRIQGRAVRLGAMAKGAGMIAPRLDGAARPGVPLSATMLAFITTDAAIAAPTLQRALELAAAESFNRVSVDNHASCSDSVFALASGLAAAPGAESGSSHSPPMIPIRPDSLEFEVFSEALREICRELALQIVRDGEGATRIFKATVTGTPDHASAMVIAREIVNSPLVKCAMHGADPNWGRIVTAAGNAGVPFKPSESSLRIGPVEVYSHGVPVVAALNDPRLREAMSSECVECVLRVGSGPGSAWMIGCDLSEDYVRINADYTT
jgi:glutamate N-acetyltransferase/amino-acid N-acetyltransferase